MELMDVTLRESIYFGSGIGYEEGIHYLEHLVRYMSEEDIQYVEVGYLNTDVPGDLNYHEDYLEKALDICRGKFKVVAMMHPGKADMTLWDRDLLKQLAMVRIVINGDDVPDSVGDYIDVLHDLGIRTSLNIAYIMNKSEAVLARMYNQALQQGADIIYSADSSGGASPSDIMQVSQAMNRLKKGNAQGMHLHDHLQMSAANALVAYHEGLDFTDISITCAGKGGGNLKAEMFIPLFRQLKGQPVTLELLKGLLEYVRYFEHLINRNSRFYEKRFLASLTGLFRIGLRVQEELEKKASGDSDRYLQLVMDLVQPDTAPGDSGSLPRP